MRKIGPPLIGFPPITQRPDAPDMNTPDNPQDWLDQTIDNYVDAMCNSVRTGYVVHPTENVISPYHGKFQIKKAIRQFTEAQAKQHQKELHRRLQETHEAYQIELLMAEIKGLESGSRHSAVWMDMRVGTLQAELAKLEGGAE